MPEIETRRIEAQGGRFEIMGSPAVLLRTEQTHAILGSLTQTPEIVLAQRAVDIVNQADNARLKLWEGMLASATSRPPEEFDSATSIEVIKTFIRQEIDRRNRGAETRNRWAELLAAAVFGGLISIGTQWILRVDVTRVLLPSGQSSSIHTETAPNVVHLAGSDELAQAVHLPVPSPQGGENAPVLEKSAGQK
jgi:hypothetical protein